MKKSKQRKREMKRRAERRKRREEAAPLAYHGRKYRTEELLPVLFETELAIYEAFVLSGISLTDAEVRRSLEKLVRQIRSGQVDVEQATLHEGGDLGDFLTSNLLGRWRTFFQQAPHPGGDNLVGILRTVLGSVENHATVSRSSQEYLRFIEGFFRSAGVQVGLQSGRQWRADPLHLREGEHLRSREPADLE